MAIRVREIDTGNNEKRAKRKNDRIVVIPPCADRVRRARLEGDDIAWLLYYFAAETGEVNRFTYEFTGQQLEMIAAIAKAINEGGDQAIAASRGEGKSTIAWRLMLKYVLQGKLKFPVLFAATGSAAANTLEELKIELESNERLREDYPEVVYPVLALEGIPQRAGTMLANGHRHDNGKPFETALIRFSWCGQQIYLPEVPGSPCKAAIIATRGLDAEVRGLRIKGRRVDLGLIDDPDTEETARSEEQAGKLEKRIDRAIAGLGGQKRTIARILLTTIQSTISVSYKFTDPVQKPSWRGKRYRFLVQQPTHLDDWQTYISLWQQDQANGTNQAGELYRSNRARMDEGAIVSNPHRFTDNQLSALEHYYTLVARYGEEAVATEYDNNPPEESGPVESGITSYRVQRQVSGYDRKIVPPGCTVLTQGIDVRKLGLHWVVRAWRTDGTGFVIDYGIQEVTGTTYGSDDGVDVAIRRAILARMEATRDEEYRLEDGQRMPVDLTLVDAGWRTQAVYAACSEVGLGIYPIMGFGRSGGCAQANFSDVQRTTRDKKPGDGWFLSRKGTVWLVAADADRWKAWEHDRWMTAPNKPGSLLLYGISSNADQLSADEKAHHAYSKHITNEIEVEEPYKGTVRRRWKEKSDNTHWLDASYYSNVAANMKGIRVRDLSQAVKVSGPAPTARELAALTRR